MSLRDLEEELYKQEFNPVTRGAARAVEPARPPPAPDRWPAPPGKPEQGSALLRRPRLALIGGVLAAVGVLAVGAAFFFAANRDVGTVDVSIDGPDRLFRGVPFSVTVGVSNQRATPLRQTVVEITLPDGVVAAELSPSLIESIGDVPVGAVAQQRFTLLPVGETRSVLPLTATVTYAAEGRAKLSAAHTQDVAIAESGLALEIQKVEKVPRGTPVEVTLTYRNVSGYDFGDVVIRARYPAGFVFQRATRPPDETTGTWHLGAVRAGTVGTLTFSGAMDGPDDARFGIPVVIAARLQGREYPLAEQTATLVIAPAPLTVTIAANGAADAIVHPGDTIVYTVAYRNTSGIALADVVARARLESEWFDLRTVATDGQFSSAERSILWNASTDGRLRLLEPGAAGSVSFTVRLQPTAPSTESGGKNFTVRMDVGFDSPSVPFYLTGTKTAVQVTAEVKIAGQFTFASPAFYRDLGARFANQGPFPPRANQATEYTVHWVLGNQATDLGSVRIAAFLERGVSMTGEVWSSVSSTPTWNDRTQEVAWVIDRVPAGSGVSTPPVEAVFQVRAVPNSLQVGQFMPLLGASSLSGTDLFTNLGVTARAGVVSTKLENDPTVGLNEGRVLP